MSTSKIVRLPIWVVLALLIAGLLSVLLAPGIFATIVWMGVFTVSIYGVWLNFSSEAKRLKAAHVGQTVDKDKLKSDLKQALPVPLWLLATMGVSTIWVIVPAFQVLGFLAGVIIILAFLGVVGFAAYMGYKAAKKKGMI
jgi:hypothetical protein